VPTFSWMAPRQALADLFLLELSGELSQSDTNEHTPLAVQLRWHGFPPVDSTSCPPHRR
jgi:hypothetical protein